MKPDQVKKAIDTLCEEIKQGCAGVILIFKTSEGTSAVGVYGEPNVKTIKVDKDLYVVRNEDGDEDDGDQNKSNQTQC